MPLIQVYTDIKALIEKGMRYRYGYKERERSHHAVAIGAGEWRPSCPTRHSRIGWSGPPHDKVQSVTCLDCGAFVTEDEMKEVGFNFNDCPDWVFFNIMERKRNKRFFEGNPVTFYPK